jgi:hypothetical protein
MAYTTINKPSDYFNTVTYTGSGTSPQSVTGVGFQPDWIWIKNRSDGYSGINQDVIRGFGASKHLITSSTVAEGGVGVQGDNYGHLSTADSDGFTVTHTINASDDGGTIRKATHYSGNNYVAWNWLAGGTASSNTDGSITSSVSANPTAGFSIVSYTGTGNADSVGHGLNQKPDITIIKRRDGATNWIAYTDVIDGSFDYLLLNTTDAKGDASSFTMDSDTLNIEAGSTSTNVNGSPYISYCFHSVKGFSKFGSFTGNGNADGTFVYTGFKPAFIIEKRSNATGSWLVFDSKRNGINGDNHYFYADGSDAELTTQLLDITSNGFKHRHAGGANGGESIYMAFAESPTVTSTGTPTTAR